VQDPSRYAKAVCDAGASSVTLHIEAPGLQQPMNAEASPNDKAQSGATWEAVQLSGARALAQSIRACGARAGVAMNPETPAACVLPLIKDGAVDLVRCIRLRWQFPMNPDKGWSSRLGALHQIEMAISNELKSTRLHILLYSCYSCIGSLVRLCNASLNALLHVLFPRSGPGNDGQARVGRTNIHGGRAPESACS